MRKIIHMDLDAFFCSVEELKHPELIGHPFAVGGRPEARGVISSCSYAARAKGIRSAMPTSRALKLCPNLILISGHHHDYGSVSEKVMEIVGRYTPLVEQVSIDECFLDVSDLPQSAEAIARELQKKIGDELGLPCSVGVATNKLVAKMATDVGKSRHRGVSPPRAVTVVPPGEEAQFLDPLPIQALWGVGPKSASRMEQLGIHTIGDLARSSEHYLSQNFGKYGRELWLHAQGLDDRPLETEHAVKSISQEITFDRDIIDTVELKRTLRMLSEQVAFRLRRDGLTASTVRVKIRWPDFSLQSRQFTLQHPTDIDTVIASLALDLFEHAWDHQTRVRLLGVGVSGLETRAQQLSFLDQEETKQRHLLEALDALRARFGQDAVRRADSLVPKKKH